MATTIEEMIEQIAQETGRTVEQVKASLRDEADHNWPALRAALQRGILSLDKAPMDGALGTMKKD